MASPPTKEETDKLVSLVFRASMRAGGSDEELEAFSRSEACTSRLIVRARIASMAAGFTNEGRQAINTLSDLLQVKLTEEHVAAQERMSRAAEKLQEAALKVSHASWGIGVASFIVTAAALYIAVVVK